MRPYYLIAAIALSACSVAPTVPTKVTKPAIRDVAYDINIPYRSIASDLARSSPNGVRLAPFTAQRQWDYTADYHGSPNVYFGDHAPACQYSGVGIVVAPLRVAMMDQFTSADWPIFEPNLIYAWVGQFVYTPAATPGTFTIDSSATCGTPR